MNNHIKLFIAEFIIAFAFGYLLAGWVINHIRL